MFSLVTRMALAMARSRAEPWAFITVPLKPRRGAPPNPSGSMRRLMVRNAFWASNAPSWRRGFAVSSRLSTVDAGGWDTHANNFEALKRRKLPEFDVAWSALLQDMH